MSVPRYSSCKPDILNKSEKAHFRQRREEETLCGDSERWREEGMKDELRERGRKFKLEER